jgi:membrane fusion protein, multidrug efflux system
MKRVRIAARLCALAIGPALLLSGCGEKQAPPKTVPTVGVVVAQPTTAPIDIELPGRTSPTLTSDVRPQVSGLLVKRLFTEGLLVKAGQPLYQIDPRLYRAAVGQALGNLQSAEAAAVTARLRAQRYSELLAVRGVSKQDADDARATAGQAEATITQTRAALDSARVNLGFATIRAPISGRIGRSVVTAGQLVTANQADALSTIQQLDPIFVDIQQSSAQLLTLRRGLVKGGVAPASAPVRLKLEDGTDYGETGRLEFSEVTVDPSTGAVTLRARFPNRNGLLLPGMYVRAVVTQAERPDVFKIPAEAVQRGPRGDANVLVVGKGDKVETRPIETASLVGDAWIVTKGLNAGDRVIVQGSIAARPGTQVRTVRATGAAAESALIAPPQQQQQGGAQAGAQQPAR